MTIRKTKLYRTNLRKRPLRFKLKDNNNINERKNILNMKHSAKFYIESRNKQDRKALTNISVGLRNTKNMFDNMFESIFSF